MFQNLAPFFKVIVKATAAQGPGIICNFTLMAYNQENFFPCYCCTALREVRMCDPSKGFYWPSQHSTT